MAHVDDETTPLWVWCGLSAIACASFWFQAVITEEFFVPALNVIANGFNIPDDSKSSTLCLLLPVGSFSHVRLSTSRWSNPHGGWCQFS